MDKKVLASRLVDIASDLADMCEKQASDENNKEEAKKAAFNAFDALRGVREAQGIVAKCLYGKTRKADTRVTIDRLPGFSPMQLRQQIDQVVSARQRATQIRNQFEAVLKELAGLEDVEEAGIKQLKTAAQQVKEKEKYLVEAEKGLLQFTAFVQRKRPGVEQMLADPSNSKFGNKAGDFFNRVGAKLGRAVQDAVQEIYTQTEEDLTHIADCVTGLKVVERTASVKTATLKKAGIADAIVALKDWLAGKGADSMVSRLINFAGNIGRFVRGFVERTGLVRKATKNLTDALDEAQSEIDNALATA